MHQITGINIKKLQERKQESTQLSLNAVHCIYISDQGSGLIINCLASCNLEIL
jgi:hypothetical protein